jgi:hypothetical protein
MLRLYSNIPCDDYNQKLLNEFLLWRGDWVVILNSRLDKFGLREDSRRLLTDPEKTFDSNPLLKKDMGFGSKYIFDS